MAKIIDSSGNVVRTYTYDAWGKTTVGAGSVDSAFRYAGGYFDAAGGLYKFGTRYYHPTIGRWTQQDAISSPGTLNRYAYVGGDPVNRTDPSGYEWCDPTDWEAEDVGTALSIGGTALGIASVFFTGGASLALGAAAAGLGTAGGGLQCGATGAGAAAGIGILGGGVAGAFTEGGLAAAGITTSLGGEAANYVVC